MDDTSSMNFYVKLNWDASRFLQVASKDCMNSASYEYRNMSARRGAQFVPMGMPIICWKTFTAKTSKMLLTRNSSILMMSSSVYLLFESECSLTSKREVPRDITKILQNRVPRDLKLIFVSPKLDILPNSDRASTIGDMVREDTYSLWDTNFFRTLCFEDFLVLQLNVF